MTYSLQLYTLRTAMGADLPGTIERVAALGYTAVEPYNFVATADELAEALSANGLSAPSSPATRPSSSATRARVFCKSRKIASSSCVGMVAL